MATSDNALVSASQTSSVLIPKAGSYNFVSNDDGTATLGGSLYQAVHLQTEQSNIFQRLGIQGA